MYYIRKINISIMKRLTLFFLLFTVTETLSKGVVGSWSHSDYLFYDGNTVVACYPVEKTIITVIEDVED